MHIRDSVADAIPHITFTQFPFSILYVCHFDDSNFSIFGCHSFSPEMHADLVSSLVSLVNSRAPREMADALNSIELLGGAFETLGKHIGASMLEISNRVEITNTLKHEMSANAAQYEGIITPRRAKSRLSSSTRSCQDPVALRTTRSRCSRRKMHVVPQGRGARIPPQSS